MKKYIANVITIFRIVGSVLMIFFSLYSYIFIILYILCGMTDILDGIIDRKTNTTSKSGAILDTGADFIYIGIALIKILLEIVVPIWLLIWVAVIFVIKVLNVVAGLICSKKIMVEHTILNKITGILLFFHPLTLIWINIVYSATLICIVSTFSAIQEGCYIKKGYEVL